MQRKIFNRDGTFRKDNRPIDVGGNLRITLESGVITTYQLMGGIVHEGNFDSNGHYFAILRYNGQFWVVNQDRPITAATNGLAQGQIFVYRRHA